MCDREQLEAETPLGGLVISALGEEKTIRQSIGRGSCVVLLPIVGVTGFVAGFAFQILV